MALTDKTKKVIDIVQWILIIALVVLCAVVFVGNKRLRKEQEIRKEDTYIKIYQSQKIAELEKKNKALYDSITVLNGREPEYALEIRYKYKFKTDTLRVTEFAVSDDSIYHYTNDNDTIKTDIDIKAKDLDWCKVDAQINDKFTIINKTDGNENETTIGHSPNVDITGVDVWHRKTTLKDRIFFGPSINLGYNPFTKKIEPTIGISLGIDISKKKKSK